MSKITTEIAKKALRGLGYNLEKLPFSLEDFTFGMNVELEHGKHDKETNVSDDDPKITAKITLAHLKESPLYYKELKKMESKLEKKADEIISCMEKCAKKKSPFQRLRDNQVPFTREEAGIARAKKAVWNDGRHAVWKSKNSKTGEVTYVTNTHRCYQTAPTLKGAISKFHSFVKKTASEDSDANHLEKRAELMAHPSFVVPSSMKKQTKTKEYVCQGCGRKRNEKIEPHCKDCGHDHTVTKEDFEKEQASNAKNVCEKCGFGWVNDSQPGCKKCGHDTSISRDKYKALQKQASNQYAEAIEKVAISGLRLQNK